MYFCSVRRRRRPRSSLLLRPLEYIGERLRLLRLIVVYIIVHRSPNDTSHGLSLLLPLKGMLLRRQRRSPRRTPVFFVILEHVRKRRALIRCLFLSEWIGSLLLERFF